FPFCGTTGRGTNFCPGGAGVETTGGGKFTRTGGGAVGIGGGTESTTGGGADAILNPGADSGTGGGGGGTDGVATGVGADAILSPGGGVTTVAGIAVGATSDCAAKVCAMLSFAASVPSAPQDGQATRAGIRPWRGSTSKANFCPQ